MPYCPNCGKPVNENNQFCPNCGSKLPATSMHPNRLRLIDIKPRTLLTNGLIIGAGITLIIICGLAILALNGAILDMRAFLVEKGVSTTEISFRLLNINSLFSFCFSGLIFGVYFLLLGLLDQFSTRAHYAWLKKDILSRISNGLMSGGVVLSSLSITNLIQQQSFSTSPSSDILELSIIVTGFVLIALGFILLISRKPVLTK